MFNLKTVSRNKDLNSDVRNIIMSGVFLLYYEYVIRFNEMFDLGSLGGIFLKQNLNTQADELFRSISILSCPMLKRSVISCIHFELFKMSCIRFQSLHSLVLAVAASYPLKI